MKRLWSTAALSLAVALGAIGVACAGSVPDASELDRPPVSAPLSTPAESALSNSVEPFDAVAASTPIGNDGALVDPGADPEQQSPSHGELAAEGGATPEPVIQEKPGSALDQAALDRAVASSSLSSIDCPLEAPDNVGCFRALVPLHSADPDSGDKVDLFLAVIDNGDRRGSGPVVFLQGGPGVATVGSTLSSALGLDHDLILIDTRGTGESVPKLDCPEVSEVWERAYSDEPDRLAEPGTTVLIEDCARRLSETIDLSAFSSASAATDLEIVRRLLGYERWSLWGASYGTRLALTVMRDYPDTLRSVVLDSVLPFEVDFFSTLAENAVRGFSELDRACSAVPECFEDHGSFLDNLAATAKRLDREPAVVTATRPVSGERFDFRVDGSALIEIVFGQLYSTRQLRSLPRQVARVDFGGIEELVAAFVRTRDPERLDLAIGMYYSTWCREEWPFHEPQADDEFLVEQSARFGPGLAAAMESSSIGRICAAFDVEPAPPVANEPVRSQVPALVFAGRFDPITPPAWSRLASASLDSAVYVEMADHGHGMVSSCARNIRSDFLANPTADLSLSCLETVGSPRFD